MAVPGKTESAAAGAAEVGYRLLVENVTDFAIFQMDVEGNVVTWNPGAERILGFAPAEVIGRHVSVLFTPEDRAAGVPHRELTAASRDGRANDQRWHERKDGSRVYVDGVMTCLYDGDHRCHGFGKVMRDITDSIVARDGLRRTNEDLEAHVAERTSALERANAELQTQIEERKRAEAAQKDLFRRLADAQEQERLRLSRELHDELGQRLAVFHLGLHALRESIAGIVESEQLLDRLEQSATVLGREMHRLASELRPTAIDDLGLFAALSTYVEDWSIRTGIPADFHGREPFRAAEGLTSMMETAIYRVAQEALTNVYKHASATGVSIVVANLPHGSGLQMIIEDDGTGFDAEAQEIAETASASRVSLGIRGMRERAALVGGTLKIDSSEYGTSIFLEIPLPETR